MIVRTVLGDVEAGLLGATYAHEHFILDTPMVAEHMPEIHLPSVDEAVAELERCHAAGLGAVVDAMPGAAGRDVVRLAAASERSSVHIVAATGLHTERYYPDGSWAAQASEQELYDRFVAEISDGADGSEYRTGVIKVGTMGADLTDRDHRLFAAAAGAHRSTGAPILTHCEAGLGGLEQATLFDELGVSLDRVALSHTDKVIDAGYHKDLLGTGVNVVYDQALRQPPDVERGTAWLIGEMAGAGFAAQLMLGTDGARRSMWATLGGSPGLDRLLTAFSAVLDDELGRAIFVDNPARFLAFAP